MMPLWWSSDTRLICVRLNRFRMCAFSVHYSLPFELSQDATLAHYMNYTAEELLPVVQLIAKNVVKVNDGRTKNMVRWHSDPTLDLPELLAYNFIFFIFFQAVKHKYESAKMMRISSIAQLKSSLITDFAAQ